MLSSVPNANLYVQEELVQWKIMRRSGIKDYNKWAEFVNSRINIQDSGRA